jgi:hypothetical protein
MNIFVLDRHPSTAAKMVCDQHLPKQILECAQLISNIVYKFFPYRHKGLYKPIHLNHPIQLWLDDDIRHCTWMSTYAAWLNHLYELRTGERHKAYEIFLKCYQIIYYGENVSKTNNINVEDFLCLVPEECKISDDVVENYRAYYKYKDKLWLSTRGKGMTWTYTLKPTWFNS